MEKIDALTGVRGIAALWVVVHHGREKLYAMLPGVELFEPIIQYGYMAVDMFFILSGFVISLVYLKVDEWSGKDMKSYVIKRFARIYPVHLFTLLLLVVMVLGGNLVGMKVGGSYDWHELVYAICIVHAFPFSDPDWNYPSWSISAEFFAYLLVFPICLRLRKTRLVKKHPLKLSLLLLLFYVYVRYQSCFGCYNLVRVTIGFSLGYLMYLAYVNKSSVFLLCDRFLFILVTCLVIYCYVFPYGDKADVWYETGLISLLFLILCGLASNKYTFSKVLSTKFFLYLGYISYSLYMGHALIEKIFAVTLPVEKVNQYGSLVRFSIVVLHITVPVLFGSILYHFIEEPSRKWIVRNWINRGRL